MTEGIELSNQEKNRTFGEKVSCKYLGISGSGHHQISGEEKNRERLSQEIKKATRNQTIKQNSHETDKTPRLSLL